MCVQMSPGSNARFGRGVVASGPSATALTHRIGVRGRTAGGRSLLRGSAGRWIAVVAVDVVDGLAVDQRGDPVDERDVVDDQLVEPWQAENGVVGARSGVAVLDDAGVLDHRLVRLHRPTARSVEFGELDERLLGRV